MTRPSGASAEVTELLRAWRGGDECVADELLSRVYDELKRIAAAQLRGERAAHTLQPTALVHEAYVRLLDQRRVDWRDRSHFFGLAATMMRRVLVDHARARNARKRRSDEEPALTIAASGAGADEEVELLDLDRALDELAAEYPRQARVVEMRYFADLEVEEIAECLSLSPATIKRDWTFARAWLRTVMEPRR